MRRSYCALAIAALFILATLAISGPAWAATDKTPKCGAKGEKICPPAKATFLSKAKLTCPKGTFFDVSTFACWSCPKGYKRTIFGIKAKNACELPMKTSYEKAEKKRKIKIGKKGCKKGEFWDKKGGGLGACWECPKGYKRGIVAVDKGKACIKISKLKSAKATRDSKYKPCQKGFFDPRAKGQCWKCPGDYFRSITKVTAKDACLPNPDRVCDAGNIDVRGKCYKRKECGKEGQRPCLIVERIPSCNKGLMEEIVSNKCMKPAMLLCTMMSDVIKVAKAGAKVTKKAGKGAKKAEKAATDAIVFALKAVLTPKGYKGVTKITKGAAKQLQKAQKKVAKLTKPMTKKIRPFMTNDQMAFMAAAKKNGKKLFAAVSKKGFCYKSNKEKMAAVTGAIGFTPKKASLDLPSIFDGLFIKSANAAMGGTKNPYYHTFGVSVTYSIKQLPPQVMPFIKALKLEIPKGSFAPTISFNPYFVTDFSGDLAFRLGIGMGVSSGSGLDVSAFVGTVFAKKAKDVGGPGWAIGMAKDATTQVGGGLHKKYAGLSGDFDVLLDGELKKPIGYVFDVGGIGGKESSSAVSGAIEFAYDIKL